MFLHSKHPYIFFNQDGNSMTFFGIKVNENLEIVDYKTNQKIAGLEISKCVYNILTAQGVDLKKGDSTKYAKLPL